MPRCRISDAGQHTDEVSPERSATDSTSTAGSPCYSSTDSELFPPELKEDHDGSDQEELYYDVQESYVYGLQLDGIRLRWGLTTPVPLSTHQFCIQRADGSPAQQVQVAEMRDVQLRWVHCLACTT